MKTKSPLKVTKRKSLISGALLLGLSVIALGGCSLGNSADGSNLLNPEPDSFSTPAPTTGPPWSHAKWNNLYLLGHTFEFSSEETSNGLSKSTYLSDLADGKQYFIQGWCEGDDSQSFTLDMIERSTEEVLDTFTFNCGMHTRIKTIKGSGEGINLVLASNPESENHPTRGFAELIAEDKLYKGIEGPEEITSTVETLAADSETPYCEHSESRSYMEDMYDSILEDYSEGKSWSPTIHVALNCSSIKLQDRSVGSNPDSVNLTYLNASGDKNHAEYLAKYYLDQSKDMYPDMKVVYDRFWVVYSTNGSEIIDKIAKKHGGTILVHE